MNQPAIDNEELAALLRTRRSTKDLTIRGAAREALVSPATFWRAEQGDAPRDIEVFRRLCGWLGVPSSRLLTGTPATKAVEGGDALEHGTRESTLEMIDAHLRADKSLDSGAAQTISEAVRALYELAVRRPSRR